MPRDHHPADAVTTVWEPCGACWGQRVIWTLHRRGERLQREACPGCLGVGQRAVIVAA